MGFTVVSSGNAIIRQKNRVKKVLSYQRHVGILESEKKNYGETFSITILPFTNSILSTNLTRNLQTPIQTQKEPKEPKELRESRTNLCQPIQSKTEPNKNQSHHLGGG